MPLSGSPVRRASHKEEALPLLVRNGGAKERVAFPDAVSGDDLAGEDGDMH